MLIACSCPMSRLTNISLFTWGKNYSLSFAPHQWCLRCCLPQVCCCQETGSTFRSSSAQQRGWAHQQISRGSVRRKESHTASSQTHTCSSLLLYATSGKYVFQWSSGLWVERRKGTDALITLPYLPGLMCALNSELIKLRFSCTACIQEAFTEEYFLREKQGDTDVCSKP